MTQHIYNGMEYLTFPMLDSLEGFGNLFSTRIGGVSKGIYSTNNYSVHLGDSPENVLENYRRTAACLGEGFTENDFVRGDQKHTANVRVMTQADRGKGITREQDYREVDGMVTNIPGLILNIFVADCVPLYLVDPVHRAIGMAHSGWRGTVAQIGRRTLELMTERYGTVPSECYCAVGPSICADCYEIGDDVAGQFLLGMGVEAKACDEYLNKPEVWNTARSADITDRGAEPVLSGEEDTVLSQILSAKILRKEPGRPDKYLLDLWEANRWIFERAGVRADCIEVTDICTHCNSDYLFSHRTTGFRRGINGAFLVIRP